MMRRNSLIRTALTLSISAALLTQSSPTFAKGDGGGNGRSKEALGFQMNYHEPFPGAVGFGFAFNLFKVVRLTGGVGAYVDSNGVTEDTIPKAIMATFLYMSTATLVKWNTLYKFLGGDTVTTQSVFTSSLGLEFGLPFGNFSPMVGVHPAWYTANNDPQGLGTGKGYHTYYSAGVDWLSTTGLNFRVGMNYAPQLPSAIQKSLYVGIGKFSF